MCTLRVANPNYFAVSPTCFGLAGALSRNLIQNDKKSQKFRHGNIKITYTLVSDKTTEFIFKNKAYYVPITCEDHINCYKNCLVSEHVLGKSRNVSSVPH